MRRFLLFVLLAVSLSLSGDTTVTLLHFSDYHSQAVPFYTEKGELGGLARAIGYLRAQKRSGALVFSGGDMINKGAPAWSDAWGCVEWPWLDGVVDAMAFGNHDADYGLDAFRRCRGAVRFPILSANTDGFAPYRVFEARGVRIGVFSVAGSDFPQLVKTPGLTFGDPVEAARRVVRELKEKERVDAVVMIGHEHAEADYALARAVPGIDLIFGSHSHLERDLTRIEGTSTWFISPWQYLTFVSRVELTIGEHGVTGVHGALVPVDGRMPVDRKVARRIRTLQRRLERKPEYAALFAPIGKLEAPMDVATLAAKTLGAMKDATAADVALSTASSFRRPLPAGVLTLELLRGSLPYDNEIVVCSMSGAELQRVLDYSESRKAGDSWAYVAAPPAIDPAKSYRVAATDYLAHVAYRDVFTCAKSASGKRVRAELAARF